MPPIREIDFSDGIRIVTSNGRTVQIQGAQINALSGNLAQKERRLNDWLQQQYEYRYPLSSYDSDHPVHTNPSGLPVWRRIEGSEVVETEMFIAAHIFSLSPLKVTTRCQNKEAGLITGDWWL